MSALVELRRGAYVDSVSLMQVSRRVAELPGVDAALVAMATELNVDLLAGMGFDRPPDASPGDLLVAVRAADDAAMSEARLTVDAALAELSRPVAATGPGAVEPPRTVRVAAARSGATLALVSVPGPHAFTEAMDALEAGLSVMVFSDNVPLDQEIRLKEEGDRRGLLVMGPDCGTAIVGGVGLGFANAVRGGPVGVIAASGTGAQQLTCLLDAAAVGVSHVLGVGGRDLSAAVGGRSTLPALAALDEDPGTELIVVVSKPPAVEVAERVAAAADGLRTRVVLAFLGRDREDLSAVAAKVVAATGGGSFREWPEWLPDAPQQSSRGALRGLFAGGTLCDEAMVIAAEALGPVRSNIPLEPAWALPDDLRAEGHLMLDFGDDRLTAGRAHPMIDPTLRLERLAAEAADPSTGVVLLDVVLGFGAHPDPAADLAPAIAGTRAAGKQVVVSLCGAAGDVQGLERQAEMLRAAGASVHLSNAAAARRAVALVEGG